MLTLYLISFVIILFVLTLYVRYCNFGRKLAEIPGPRGLPLIGNALVGLGIDPESAFLFIRDLNKTYGPINKLTSGLIGIVNITEPDYVEKLFGSHRYTAKLEPYTFLRSWLGEGLLISNGEKWRYHRKLLTPAFHFTALKRFQDMFNNHTEVLLARLQEETEKERTNIGPLIITASLNIIRETLTGRSVEGDFESITKKYLDALHIYGEILLQRLRTVFYHIDWIYKLTMLRRKEKEIVKNLHKLTYEIVQERKINFNKNYMANGENSEKKLVTMLDILLETERQGKIDMNSVKEDVDSFLFAGHDTTAMALCFMIMRIANETEIQDEIYAELVHIFGESQRSPTNEDLSEMKYLECCIKESLRVYPSVHFLPRLTLEDVNLGKYTVPKGAITFIHVYDIHHNAELYPEPERFDPERFRSERCAARHPYSYIPFSAGPRNCIGQKFAMAELKTVMSGVLRRFRLEPVTRHEDIHLVGDLILRSKDPLYVRFRNRKEN